MKTFGGNLRAHRDDKDDREDCGADEIAEMHRHRNGIAAGFSQCRRGDFDDPEAQRYGRNLAQCFRESRGYHVDFYSMIHGRRIDGKLLFSSKA